MNRFWLTVGILCFLIPFVLQELNGREQETVISTFDKVVEEYGAEEQERCYQKALSYNQMLLETYSGELSYEEQLNLTGTGMMGNIEIPKINLRLPIYHGTGDDVLAAGIGHLEGTALPVGGESCHTVLTGHCGLPNAELFTRLDEMEKGDCFYLRICGKVLGYQVMRIQVVNPDDSEAIEIEPEKDLVSLVTCTPYGLNTHRLIVTGERMEENVETSLLEETKGGMNEKDYCYAVAGIGLFLLLIRRSCRRKCGTNTTRSAECGVYLQEGGREERR